MTIIKMYLTIGMSKRIKIGKRNIVDSHRINILSAKKILTIIDKGIFMIVLIKDNAVPVFTKSSFFQFFIHTFVS